MASKKKTFSTRKQSSSLFLAHTEEEYKDFLFLSFSLTRERNKWREWKETLKDLRRGCKNIASLPSPHTVSSFNEKCHYNNDNKRNRSGRRRNQLNIYNEQKLFNFTFPRSCEDSCSCQAIREFTCLCSTLRSILGKFTVR